MGQNKTKTSRQTNKRGSVSTLHPPPLHHTTPEVSNSLHNSVIQRQNHLIHHQGHTPSSAYDTARKEFYRLRHSHETESRVAREEALATGAFFTPGPNEIGMKLEDREYENWKKWAEKEIEALRQLSGSAYTGGEAELGEGGGEIDGGVTGQAELGEVSENVPASRRGQEARGGAAVHV